MSKTTNEMIAELSAVISEVERVSKEYKKNFNYVSSLATNANKLLEEIIKTINYLDENNKNILLPPAVIVKTVQDKYKVQISSRTRKNEYANARHIACYFLKKFTRMSFSEIGEFVGLFDHSSVMHGVNNVKKFMSLETEYLDDIFDLEQRLINIYKEKHASNNISGVKSDRQAVLQSD